MLFHDTTYLLTASWPTSWPPLTLVTSLHYTALVISVGYIMTDSFRLFLPLWTTSWWILFDSYCDDSYLCNGSAMVAWDRLFIAHFKKARPAYKYECMIGLHS